MNFLRNKRRCMAGMFLAMLLWVCVGCSPNAKSTVAPIKEDVTQNLTIKMLNIGQGDATLVKSASQVVLIDTGDIEMRESLVTMLKKEGITTIDKLIITHPHADHLGGAFAVLNNFKVVNVYDNGQTANTSTYRTYLKTLKKEKINYQQLSAGSKLDFGNGVGFSVFSPTAADIKSSDDLNNNSIIGKLVFGDFSMLFTGDSEAPMEKVVLQKYGKELKSTILKSPHHGSKTSSNRNYLKMVAPEAILIPVGVANDYKHPHTVTLNKYNDLKSKIYRTDQEGAITIETDGKTYNITKEK